MLLCFNVRSVFADDVMLYSNRFAQTSRNLIINLTLVKLIEYGIVGEGSKILDKSEARKRGFLASDWLKRLKSSFQMTG